MMPTVSANMTAHVPRRTRLALRAVTLLLRWRLLRPALAVRLADAVIKRTIFRIVPDGRIVRR
jgi:hypothetical protein